MISAVIFDIGNVLIGWQPEKVYDRLIGEARRKRLFAEVDLHAMNDQIDMGADFSETLDVFRARYPQWERELAYWHDNWITLTGPVIDHSVALLRALRAKGTPVFALTNFGTTTFELSRPVYPFLTEFDRAFVSGHMGFIKPEPRIYEMVEEATGLAPETLLFADDRADNIAAAEARGWKGHLFTTPEGWARRLVSEGLLTEKEAGL